MAPWLVFIPRTLLLLILLEGIGHSSPLPQWPRLYGAGAKRNAIDRVARDAISGYRNTGATHLFRPAACHVIWRNKTGGSENVSMRLSLGGARMLYNTALMENFGRDAIIPDRPVIRARGLSKRFADRDAVAGIDFDIFPGRCFGFVGPNGAGKTTTLRMAMGLTPLSGGTLTVFGKSVAEYASAIRARVGIVPQADNLDPDFSVEENLYVYASFFGLSRAVVGPRIDALLEFVSLTDRRKVRTNTLSGGMQRRLMIARALINTPELLVLDEPTTGLDPQARHVIWGRLSELKARGKTLLLTTHYMEEAERLCDELVIMDHGCILAQGSPQELVRQYVEPEVVEVRGEGGEAFQQLADACNCRLERMGTSLYCYARDTGPMIGALQKRPGLKFIHRPSGLEDVFLRLTGRELRD
jgi:lipooligosaccharide transport system ATP-binding protein